MKILMVSEDVPYPSMGGLAKHALALARALRAAGHEVDFLGNSLHPASACAELADFADTFHAGLSGEKVGWKETSLGLFLPPRRTWLARRYAKAILSRAAGYDVVHYHGHVPNVAAFIPADVNFVQTRHDQGADCLMHTRFLEGQICRRTDPADCAVCIAKEPNGPQRWVSGQAVTLYRKQVLAGMQRHATIFVSDMLRSNLQRTAGSGRWGDVVHNFVDAKQIASVLAQAQAVDERMSSLGPDVRRIVVPGKLYPPKGVDVLLEAVARNTTPGQHWFIVGDGPDEARLKQAHEGAQVHFMGWRSQSEVLGLMRDADAVAVPSVWEEPCATTVLEGLSLGRTVLALAQGGTPELVAYEQFPGQLQLFGDMPALVAAAAKLQRVPSATEVSRVCAVEARLDEVLAIYRRRLKR